MFEDFDKSASSREGRGRMGVSFLISGLIFGGIMAGLGAAIATAHVVAKRRQADIAVAFADMPRAPKPKPVVAARSTARKAVKPRPAAAPKEIPKERPEEAEGELVAAGNVAPIEGIVEEKAKPAAAPPPPPPPPPKPQPTAPPPEQEREMIAKPKFVAGCRAPDVPEALQSLAATVMVDVRMLIGPDGKVLSAEVIKKTHPLIPDEVILRCVREQVFEPAHLPDGTAVQFPFHRRFVFKPASA